MVKFGQDVPQLFSTCGHGQHGFLANRETFFLGTWEEQVLLCSPRKVKQYHLQILPAKSIFRLGSNVTVWGCILNPGSFPQQAIKLLKTMTICYAMAQRANPSFLLTSYQLQLWHCILGLPRFCEFASLRTLNKSTFQFKNKITSGAKPWSLYFQPHWKYRGPGPLSPNQIKSQGSY